MMTEPITVTALNQYVKGLMDGIACCLKCWYAVKFQTIKSIHLAIIISRSKMQRAVCAV